MNNRRQIELFLAQLGELYAKEVTMANVSMVAEAIGPELAEVDLQALAKRLVLAEKFYPAPATILEHAGIGKPVGDRELAATFVDKASFYFSQKPTEAYERLGSDGYRLAKYIGMDPFGLKNGNQDHRALRFDWIANLERVMEAEPGWKDFLLAPPPKPHATLEAPEAPKFSEDVRSANVKRLQSISQDLGKKLSQEL